MHDHSQPADTAAPQRQVRVWDLPTRLFHWLLVLFVIVSFSTAAMGPVTLRYHMWSGYTILTLLLFRLGWGVWGGRYSRFAVFVRGPRAVLRYARTLLSGPHAPHLGHNPLGGWSILAMLAALLVQAATGLFANDDIMNQGPLYAWISKATSDRLTVVHGFNPAVIIALVAVHLAAVLFYLWAKGDNLIKPMLTGFKAWQGDAPSAVGRWWAALLIALLSAAAVYLLVR